MKMLLCKDCVKVELQGDAALVPSGVVLVEDPLADRLVNGGDSNLGSGLSGLLIAGGGGTLELLEVGLEQRLGSLVLLILSLGDENSFLGRLDIGHEKHLLHISN